MQLCKVLSDKDFQVLAKLFNMCEFCRKSVVLLMVFAAIQIFTSCCVRFSDTGISYANRNFNKGQYP